MSLTEKKILANTKKYFETTEKLGIMPDGLKALLGDKFSLAPSALDSKFGNAFEGGLIEYLLRVAFYAVRANNSMPDEEKVNQESLLKVCLLHHIGKLDLNHANPAKWSVYYAMNNGVQLTPDEYSAITLCDEKDSTDNTVLGELLKFGMVFANKQAVNHE